MYHLLFFFIYSTSWWSQPLTRGSYTAVAIGSSQVDITNVAQSLYAHPSHHKVIIYQHYILLYYQGVYNSGNSGKKKTQGIRDLLRELL